MEWNKKKCLVTGSEGLIGKELVLQLKELGCIINCVDKKLTQSDDITDITNVEVIFRTEKPDYVFHLFGVKGNPKMTKERPVDFMGPMLQGDTNMILMSQKYGVKKFLYTSSIAVENSQTDRFPACAKKTAEELIHAMRTQYNNIATCSMVDCCQVMPCEVEHCDVKQSTEFCIVRPANVYGRFDNFDNPDAMVVTSLISKAMKEDTINIWGDGSHVRDFINAKDVARGMIETMEKMPFEPVNLCSGYGVTIKQIAEIISRYTGKPIKYIPVENLLGDKKRVMRPIHKFIETKITIEDGIKEAIDYVKNS